MSTKRTAYFVRRPRRIDDLHVCHPISEERAYEIVKTVFLDEIDYENFITDMLVGRQFLEDNSVICLAGTVLKCLLITIQGKRDGILVLPENDLVMWAALYME